MPKSKLGEHAKSLTGAKVKKRDPLREAIIGRIETAAIPLEDIQRALGKSESATRVRLRQPGSEWKIKDIVTVCKVIGLPVEEALCLVTEKYYS